MSPPELENMEGKTPLELQALGTRAYWMREYTNAAVYLSRASELFVEEHKDDKHNSLGNVYLIYGKTLLEIVRQECNPLGDAVPKEVSVEEEEDDDDDEGILNSNEDENGEEDMEENEAEKKGDGNDDDSEKEKPKTAKEGEAGGTKVADISINGEAATFSNKNAEDEDEEEEGEEAEGENGEAGEGDDDAASGSKREEADDLQVAWEVLELAKIIFERRGDEGREDMGDCLMALGEVSLENENFDSAVADMTAGLEIYKRILTESDQMRKLAEAYYKLAMALSANNKFDEGIANYERTLEILKERLEVLKKIEKPGCSDEDEITDITGLIPELEDKINDLKNLKDEVGDIDTACKDIIAKVVADEMKRLKVTP